MYLFRCDEDVIIPGVTDWPLFKHAADEGEPIVWDYQGQCRLLPGRYILDLWGVIQAYDRLRQLGRIAEVPHGPFGIPIDATIPLTPGSQPEGVRPTEPQPIQPRPLPPQSST
jgi:hypothetical protein